ncbi:hypothetical protein BDK51DRAFT_28476, partial [Blyttiomyces helicus]
ESSLNPQYVPQAAVTGTAGPDGGRAVRRVDAVVVCRDRRVLKTRAECADESIPAPSKLTGTQPLLPAPTPPAPVVKDAREDAVGGVAEGCAGVGVGVAIAVAGGVRMAGLRSGLRRGDGARVGRMVLLARGAEGLPRSSSCCWKDRRLTQLDR